jgi:hypothetical protein
MLFVTSHVIMSRALIEPFSRRLLKTALPLALAGLLLALAPFAVALEVHHELAAADEDGHQHSDTDLCQWVQHHTGSSLLADAPVLQALCAQVPWSQPVAQVLLSLDLPRSAAPRAPPLS